MQIGTIIAFKRGQPARVVSNETLTVFGKEIVNNRLLEIQHADTPENLSEYGFFLTDEELTYNAREGGVQKTTCLESGVTFRQEETHAIH